MEALRRAATLHLPTQRYTMFPKSIACDTPSLGGEHRDGSARSFVFRILEDGALGTDVTMIIASSIIFTAPQRGTYEEVDELLISEGEVCKHDISVLTRLAEKRLAFGLKTVLLRRRVPSRGSA